MPGPKMRPSICPFLILCGRSSALVGTSFQGVFACEPLFPGKSTLAGGCARAFRGMLGLRPRPSICPFFILCGRSSALVGTSAQGVFAYEPLSLDKSTEAGGCARAFRGMLGLKPRPSICPFFIFCEGSSAVVGTSFQRFFAYETLLPGKSTEAGGCARAFRGMLGLKPRPSVCPFFIPCGRSSALVDTSFQGVFACAPLLRYERGLGVVRT